MKKGIGKFLGGIIIGTLNGMFGAGGGIMAVPMLRKSGIEDKSAHASSIAIILPISLVSISMYIIDGRVNFTDGLPYILPGIIGAVAGTFILSKIPRKWLHRVFGTLIIYAGIRLILK